MFAKWLRKSKIIVKNRAVALYLIMTIVGLSISATSIRRSKQKDKNPSFKVRIISSSWSLRCSKRLE